MRYIFKKKRNIFLVSLFDFFGSIVFLPFKLFKKKIPGNIGKILIIRLDHIGDVVFSTMVPQNLKSHYKGAKITLLVGSWARDIVINNPYIDEVICYDAPWFDKNKKGFSEVIKFIKLCSELRKHDYDIGFDLRGDLRHILLMLWGNVKFRVGLGITGGSFLLHKKIEYRDNVNSLEHNLDSLRGMNMAVVNDSLQLYSSQKEKTFIGNFLQKHSIGETDAFVVIHPFSRNISKNWLDERFARLIAKLNKDYGLRIVIIGSEKDKKQIDGIIQLSGIDAINSAGSISLGALLELFKKAGLFIGVDSAPSHIAGLSKKPSVVLYSGTNNPDEWALVSEAAAIIQKDISCKGCERTDCRDNICMDLISVYDVLEAVDKVFKK